MSGGEVRFGWGLHGLRDVAVGARAVVVVDVLSFSTTVSVATARGASVWPTRWGDQGAAETARHSGAFLACRRRETTADQPYSLSPVSVAAIASGTRLVLPSPNGATLCAEARTSGVPVLVGCLRNCSAVAEAAGARGGPVGVVAAGERWPDGSLRPALEDLLGAGAVISRLWRAGGLEPSPDARAAAAASEGADLASDVAACPSGRELVGAGFGGDVEAAVAVDADGAAALMAPDGWIAAA